MIADNYVWSCDDCGKVLSRETVIPIYDCNLLAMRHVCSECAENYPVCADCGKHIFPDCRADTDSTDVILCSYCVTGYHVDYEKDERVRRAIDAPDDASADAFRRWLEGHWREVWFTEVLDDGYITFFLKYDSSQADAVDTALNETVWKEN